mgnify:CR=1 FL=1
MDRFSKIAKRIAARAHNLLTLGEIDSINKDIKKANDLDEVISILSKNELEILDSPVEINGEKRYEIGYSGTGKQTGDKAVLREKNSRFLLDIPKDQKEIKRERAILKRRKPVGPFTKEPRD